MVRPAVLALALMAGGLAVTPVRDAQAREQRAVRRMETDTWKRCAYGHTLLHGFWRHARKHPGLKMDSIKAEHSRVVGIILNRYHRAHYIKDSLDETLPAELYQRSTKPEPGFTPKPILPHFPTPPE